MKYRRRYAGDSPWLSCFAVFLSFLAGSSVVGCGTILYKSGSTGGDYQAASDRCQKGGRAESPDFERCMQEQGWSAKQFGAPAATNDAETSAPVASPSPGSQPPPVADVDPPSKPSETPSAQQPVVVKNWFKLGGTAADLDAAKQRCATKLGATDRQEPDSQTVTPEMLDCLRNEGWRAF